MAEPGFCPASLPTTGPRSVPSRPDCGSKHFSKVSLFLVFFSVLDQPTLKLSPTIVAKEAAGFPPTLTDPWGRLLSYQLLYGPDGGVADTDSGLAQLSNFTNFNIPYPIITAIGVPTPDTCVPDAGATQYEIHPASLVVSL